MANIQINNTAEPNAAQAHFSAKLDCETDCSDVYADIKQGKQHFVLVDTRSAHAFAKSHAITAINIPNNEITAARMADFAPDTLFVVYCWGPGCNGASKAGYKLAQLGFKVKEMIGGIHYWEDFERYPVNRHLSDPQQ
ncbi:rhodanese-like domain-containing protein [Pseudoalteromonas luteoviolacea]|nr:rhodanese-like domain-containing protein [Pseudoalteromonas luteoviolacea]KZN78683.1 hypothetical protein N477_07650 [Pseudoalteromonas luteoviolacea H33-S]MBQ4876046.1 sulfurtransferase [Pseudoalteromonas luteoviolacea]MBQ4905681.1 sulfurtransferase [Pseudoalteromonas luteoviolacea]